MAKYQTFLAVGDNHGDKVDEEVADALFRFLKDNPCDHRIHLGDIWDFRSIRLGANHREQNESMDRDWLAGEEFIKRLEPTVVLLGNHDDRVDTGLETATNAITLDFLTDLKSDMMALFKSVGCKKIYPYHADLGVHRLGSLAMVHGYTCGRDAVEVHAKHYAVPGGGLLMGHLHSIQAVNAAKHGGAVGFSGGCLCKKSEMRYAKNRLATSRWGSGWLYGFVQGSEWKVWQAHKVGREFVVSGISKEYLLR